jgi:ArsR family transcriptional regulator, arsenate/arsenite/antimonite-responsive transcriptional repressor
MRREVSMDINYADTAKVLKAISDPKRLCIVDMLSCGELCAAEIQSAFGVGQSTISHDMKILMDAEIVKDRKQGKYTCYSLNAELLTSTMDRIHKIFSNGSGCICETIQPIRK